MSEDENPTPLVEEGVTRQKGPKRARAIVADPPAKKGTKPAAKKAPRIQGEPPIPEPIPESTEGKRLLAYLGPETRKACYRTEPHLIFEPNEESNGHPVAYVNQKFGDHLIENTAIKTYANGKAREVEDWAPMYAWLDDVQGRKIHPIRRQVAHG